jgi:ubiquinone/menaquinone biosynthesis C-methylase UbiE
MGKLGAWWRVLSTAGPGLRAGRQFDSLYRYYVSQSLAEIGFFEFLSQPRSYGEILVQFGFLDSDYTREVLDTLVKDPHGFLVLADGAYRVHPKAYFPSLDEILRKVDPHIRAFASLAEGMKGNILGRMREERVGISELFERGEVSIVDRFNTVLGMGLYTNMRKAVFELLTPEDRAGLKGKRLLDIGCGSGRETAELWLQFDGDIQITAVDPVPGMIELAERNFEKLVEETAPKHPPITADSRPVFKLGSATQLPFDDDSFDASFWLFVLHWTSDPQRAIRESVRVVRPGGLLLGGQGCKPTANPYFNLVVRGNRNSYGFFWYDDLRRWYRELGTEIDIVTPAGLYCAPNRKDALGVQAPGRAQP